MAVTTETHGPCTFTVTTQGAPGFITLTDTGSHASQQLTAGKGIVKHSLKRNGTVLISAQSNLATAGVGQFGFFTFNAQNDNSEGDNGSTASNINYNVSLAALNNNEYSLEIQTNGKFNVYYELIGTTVGNGSSTIEGTLFLSGAGA